MFLVLQLVTSCLFFSGTFSGVSASDAHPLECPLKKDMCSSLGHIQTKILSFNDTTGRCTVSDDCTNMTCQLIVVRSGVNVPFSLALSLDPCEIPYTVRLDVDSTLLGPVFNGIFSESRNISVVLLGVTAVVTIDIKQERYRMTLAVAVVSANSRIDFILPSEVDMYCSHKNVCDELASLEPPATSSSSIKPKFILPTPTVSMVTTEFPTTTPPTTPCCPSVAMMCSSLSKIANHLFTTEGTTGRCRVTNDCTTLSCEIEVPFGEFVIPISYELTLLTCSDPPSLKIKVFNPVVGQLVNDVFNDSTKVTLSVQGIAATGELLVNIIPRCFGVIHSVRLGIAFLNTNIEVIPPLDIQMHCSTKTCLQSANITTPVVMPTTTTTPIVMPTTTVTTPVVMPTTTKTPVVIPKTTKTPVAMTTTTTTPVVTPTPTPARCPPMCSRRYCRTSRSPVCSIRNESECTVITCKACYYSETVRTLPSGCKYKCGMGRGKEENWRCERVWSRCIRKKDREIYGIPSADMKRPRLFKCYSPPKLMEGHNWDG